MSRPRRPPAAVAALALLGAALLGGCATRADAGEATTSAQTVAIRAARTFLTDYVNPTGEVIRRDQGGDTVSEGQGYALLLAYAADERTTFARVWTWTRTHLQQPDGLFAYHWQDGRIADTEPAADADTQIAWALDLAGRQWSIPSDTTAARRIANAIAGAEIGYDDQGRPTLAAGPWAVAPGHPTQVEPGYWTFPAYTALAALTADHRWQDLSSADASHLTALTKNGSQLAPDWATLGNGQAPAAEAAPQTDTTPVAGQDGLRILVWAACQPATHGIDSSWWKLIAPSAQSGPLTRDLNGRPADTDPSPLSLVAAAAAATTAGHPRAASQLLSDASRTAARYPTYYGDAWNALGHVLLTTTLIPGCSL
jgi:endoglucanase